jgi:GT2 family glycosyltransferase
MKGCRLVILNFNGQRLLKECLPSVFEAAHHSLKDPKVTVLDNQSTDESREFVLKNFPEADFVPSGANRVLCSYNDYLKRIDEEFVILLNNDIFVDRGFVDPLLDPLEKDPQIFFAASKTFGPDKETYLGSLSKIGFRWGMVWGTSLFKDYEKKVNAPNRTMLCGSGAFRRAVFCELGGYDDLYLPGTVEDLDLCYRAYRQGWKGAYCPDSVIYHIGQVSFKKHFGTAALRRMNRRNLYLFIWKNIRSPRLLFQHFVFLPLQLLKDFFTGRWDFLAGFFGALGRLPAALRKRRTAPLNPAQLRDEEIFELSAAI